MNLGENLAKKIYKNKKTLVLLAIVALAAVGGAVYIKASQHSGGTDTTTQTHSTATKQYAPTSGGSSTASSAGKGGASSAGASSSTGSTGGSLAAPAGQLLNKQTVSLASTDPQTDPDLESICQTVPQASCDIDLTGPGNQVKDVGAKNTGSGGTVIFDWNAKTVGLTPGKWTVQAVAVQNNVTGTSHNEYLEVQP